MENYLSRITIQSNQLDGKPCIRGLRISVQTILEFLSAGNSAAEIIEQYPLLTTEDVSACLQYAAKISGKRDFLSTYLMKAVFLVDANLPFNVPVWKGDRFVFVLKINPAWDDEEIWSYAKVEELVIVTKDKDFLVKQAITGSPPKVVHIKFGNLKLKAFIDRIEIVWQEVETLLQTHTIINIYLTKIEAIK